MKYYINNEEVSYTTFINMLSDLSGLIGEGLKDALEFIEFNDHLEYVKKGFTLTCKA